MGGNAQMFRSAIILFLLILGLVACHQEPKNLESPKPQAPTGPNKPQEEKPNSEFKNLHYVIYEKGRIKWDIWAREASVYKGNRVLMTQIKVCSEPQKGFCISAQKARYNPKEGSFVFEGDVILKTPKKGELRTSRLAYLPQRETLESQERVTIDKKGLIVKGKGFVYDLRSGIMKVLHQTEVRVDG